MNGFVRAALYVYRKKQHSILMILFLAVMSATLLSCICLFGGIQTAIERTKESTQARLIISGAAFSEEEKNAVSCLDGVKTVNATASYMTRYLNSSGVPLHTISFGGATVADYGHCGILRGNSASSLDENFQNGGFTIVEGRHITQNDCNVVLLHQSLAKENGLKLGDSILLEAAEAAGTGSSELEIVGLFQQNEEQPGGLLMSHQLFENMAFADLNAFHRIINGVESAAGEKLVVSVQNPEELDAVVEAIRNSVSPQNKGQWVIEKEDALYRQAVAPLEQGKRLMSALAWIIGVVGLAVLTLLLILNVRGRNRETAVLRAMGISCCSILVQMIVENLLLFFSSLPFALAGAMVLPVLLERRLEAGTGGSIPMGITVFHFTVISAAVLLVMTAAVVLAFFPTLRQNPKNQLLQTEIGG